MVELSISSELAWTVVAAAIVVAFAAGGVYFKVKYLDTDLRAHMKEESDWRLEHVEGHAPKP